MNDEDGHPVPGQNGRLDAVLASVMGQPAGPMLEMTCGAAAQRLRMPGVGIAVAVSDQLLHSVHATSLGRIGDGLQEELGEGPAYTALNARRPVLAADLGDDDRWPAFTRAADEAGILASFSFPVGSGAIRLGTLNLYRPTADPLDDEQHADALVFARLALDLLITLPGHDGQVSSWLPNVSSAMGGSTPQLHQATGMVSAQLGIDMADALATLRAHAYSTDRPLATVAVDVVARKIRFPHHP